VLSELPAVALQLDLAILDDRSRVVVLGEAKREVGMLEKLRHRVLERFADGPPGPETKRRGDEARQLSWRLWTVRPEYLWLIAPGERVTFRGAYDPLVLTPVGALAAAGELGSRSVVATVARAAAARGRRRSSSTGGVVKRAVKTKPGRQVCPLCALDERRARELAGRPKIYRELVDRYSHTALGPTQYSASAFLGRAAGELCRRGELTASEVPATGYWSYNGRILAFSLPPGPPDGEVSTWAAFATELGFDADDWPALGYRGVDGPPPKLVLDEPWTTELGRRWFTDSQLSASGSCAWNHTADDRVPATRLVVTELRGEQDARACCDECFESVLRYVGRMG